MGKKLLCLAIFSIILIGSNIFTYGIAQYDIHTAYADAYYKPTQKIMTYFKELSDSGNEKLLKDELDRFEAEVTNLLWRDESTYKLLVENTIKTKDRLQNN